MNNLETVNDSTQSSAASSASFSSLSSVSELENEQQYDEELAETEIEIFNTTYPLLAKPFQRSALKIRNMKDTPMELKLYIDDKSIHRNYFYFVIENENKACLEMMNTARLNPAEEMTVEIMYVPHEENKERFGFIVLYSNELKQMVIYPVFGSKRHYDYPTIEERINPYYLNLEE